MGEALGHQQLLATLGRQGHGIVAAESGRSWAQIDNHVEHGASDDLDQLRLGGGRGLEMQAAERARPGGEGEVVLDEFGGDADAGERAGVPALREPSAAVAETLRAEKEGAGKAGFGDLHTPVL